MKYSKKLFTTGVCLFPTLLLDDICDGCPVYEACQYERKGQDILYGPQKGRRKRKSRKA
jgi:hypothetical protein